MKLTPAEILEAAQAIEPGGIPALRAELARIREIVNVADGQTLADAVKGLADEGDHWLDEAAKADARIKELEAEFARLRETNDLLHAEALGVSRG